MNNTLYALLAVLICAACTFLLRLAPFALFSGKRGMPAALSAIAQKLPAAIIAVLVVYCLRGIPAAQTGETAITAVSVAAVVALHLWKRNTLLSIAGGTALYMILLRVFPL